MVDTKYKHEYNTTNTIDPCTTTTNEQDTMLLFSVSAMNSTYEASVGAHCAKLKEMD